MGGAAGAGLLTAASRCGGLGTTAGGDAGRGASVALRARAGAGVVATPGRSDPGSPFVGEPRRTAAGGWFAESLTVGEATAEDGTVSLAAAAGVVSVAAGGPLWLTVAGGAVFDSGDPLAVAAAAGMSLSAVGGLLCVVPAALALPSARTCSARRGAGAVAMLPGVFARYTSQAPILTSATPINAAMLTRRRRRCPAARRLARSHSRNRSRRSRSSRARSSTGHLHCAGHAN
jgi:hypothetical protein